jgi:hypothetical protein
MVSVSRLAGHVKELALPNNRSPASPRPGTM